MAACLLENMYAMLCSSMFVGLCIFTVVAFVQCVSAIGILPSALAQWNNECQNDASILDR